MPKFLHLSQRRTGFTLVEIMIVVAIIALLAAVAVPGFLRSRKRSQATAVLNEARVLDNALTQYAVENNKNSGDAVPHALFYPYLKESSRLYNLSKSGVQLTDIVGGSFRYDKMDNGVKVDTATTTQFSDVIDSASAFWVGYR